MKFLTTVLRWDTGCLALAALACSSGTERVIEADPGRAGSAGGGAATSAAARPGQGGGRAERTSADGSPGGGSPGEPIEESGEATLEATLRFAARVGEEPFACGRTYSGQGAAGSAVQPRDLRFFVQEVRLIAGDGEEVPLSFDERLPWQAEGVALLDFEDGSGLCAAGNAAQNGEITGRVPPGDYTGLVLVVGVDESSNHLDPATARGPLQAGSMSWGWLLGYKFFVAELGEVVAAGDADGIGPSPAGSDAGSDAGPPSSDAGAPATPALGIGLLHLGSTSCVGSPAAGDITCARPNRSEVRFESFDLATQTVVVDVGALFGETDLGGDAQCHSSGAACPPLFEAFGLDFDTGRGAAGQRVFRAE